MVQPSVQRRGKKNLVSGQRLPAMLSGLLQSFRRDNEVSSIEMQIGRDVERRIETDGLDSMITRYCAMIIVKAK